MRKLVRPASLVPCLVLSTMAVVAAPSGAVQAPQTLVPTPGFGSVPLYFVEARGPAQAPALYSARTSRFTLWLTRDGLVFDFPRPGSDAALPAAGPAMRLGFVGARPDVAVEAAEPSAYKVHRFNGPGPEDWTTDIPTTEAVLYRNVYDGIDLRVYGNERSVEYDWIVLPGSDPEMIRLAASGCRTARIDADGNLVLESEGVELRQRAPRAFQVVDGRRVEVAARFESRGEAEYGFGLGAYDGTRELVIDPWILAYSTYLGGGYHEYVSALGADASGATYITGFTHSFDFPSASPTALAAGQVNDVFVTKISPEGDSLEYTALFGIGLSPCGTGCAMSVDAAGAAYICGITATSRFPVKNAFQPKFGGGYYDGFVLKLAPSGRSLVYSSYIGGKGTDEARSVAFDAEGAAYVLGFTGSDDFIVKQPFQKKLKGGQDAFVAKISPDGRSLAYATFLGGSKSEYAKSVAVNAAGEAHVAGYTYSNDFPVKKPVQSRLAGNDDIFVAKLSADGRSLRYSTYLGGTRSDREGVLALVSDGSVVVIGTTSGNFPVKNAFQKTRKGSSDGVVAKLSPTGALAFSTFLGGKGLDTLWGVAAGKDGTIYLAGYSESPDFPHKNPYQLKLKGKSDAVLIALSEDGQRLVFSTFLGGRYHDYGKAVAVGPDGAVFIGGETNSDDFPVKGGFQVSFKGGLNDMFVSAFRFGPTARTGRRR